MSTQITLDTSVTLRQAFLVMFAYLEQHWKSVGKPDELGALLSELSLWPTESGGAEPMDANVLPTWLHCAHVVINAEESSAGYRGADILLDGKPPAEKVRR